MTKVITGAGSVPSGAAGEACLLVHGGAWDIPDAARAAHRRGLRAALARGQALLQEGAFPRLAGQRPTYLYNALQAYALGERHSGMIEPIAAGLSRAEMRALARYYGQQEEPTLGATAAATASQASTSAIERGEIIAHEGIASEGIPSCTDCHGPGETRLNPAYPVLAGQYAEYLALQLRLFRKEHRGGSEYVRLMHPTAHRLTPEQVRAVSAVLRIAELRLHPPGAVETCPAGRESDAFAQIE